MHSRDKKAALMHLPRTLDGVGALGSDLFVVSFSHYTFFPPPLLQVSQIRDLASQRTLAYSNLENKRTTQHR